MKNIFETVSQLAFRIGKKVITLCTRYREFTSSKVRFELRTQSELATEVRIATAGGERQASPSLEGIRADHRGRYAFAIQFIVQGAQVLDLACGVGYGSYMIANRTPCERIVSVDSSKDAIAYASKYYNSPKIDYRLGDCLSIVLEPKGFDIVLCFETIEHITNERQLLEKFHQTLKPQGRLLCSTPNQRRIPFSSDTHPFHLRHYTPEEFMRLLEVSGFHIEQLWSQKNLFSSELTKGWDGLFNIAVCRKSA